VVSVKAAWTFGLIPETRKTRKHAGSPRERAQQSSSASGIFVQEQRTAAFISNFSILLYPLVLYFDTYMLPALLLTVFYYALSRCAVIGYECMSETMTLSILIYIICIFVTSFYVIFSIKRERERGGTIVSIINKRFDNFSHFCNTHLNKLEYQQFIHESCSILAPPSRVATTKSNADRDPDRAYSR